MMMFKTLQYVWGVCSYVFVRVSERDTAFALYKWTKCNYLWCHFIFPSGKQLNKVTNKS